MKNVKGQSELQKFKVENDNRKLEAKQYNEKSRLERREAKKASNEKVEKELCSQFNILNSKFAAITETKKV